MKHCGRCSNSKEVKQVLFCKKSWAFKFLSPFAQVITPTIAVACLSYEARS